MSAQGTGLFNIYDGRLNQYRYKDILIDNLVQSIDLFGLGEDYIYQKDNAPCHTAESIKTYILLKIASTVCHGHLDLQTSIQ